MFVGSVTSVDLGIGILVHDLLKAACMVDLASMTA
jgi:hypothetical protein